MTGPNPKTIATMKNTGTHAEKTGFTLVEVIAVLTIIGVLVGVMALPFIGLIESARMRAERQTMVMLAAEIKASFRQDDIDKNISALPGDMPRYTTGGPHETVFDYGPTAAGEMVIENAWYARLTKLRGQVLTFGTLNTRGGDIYAIAFNAYNARRVLLVGPYEASQQRYILLSFMFVDGPALPAAPGPRGDMVLNVFEPVAGYAAWFDAIYNHTWGETSDAPAGWDAAWNATNARGRSFAQRVVAERIVQPRYTVTINNLTNPTPTADAAVFNAPDRIHVYSNMFSMTDWNTAGVAECVDARDSPLPRESTNNVEMFPRTRIGILEGRRLVIRRQRNAAVANASAAEPVLSILLNENTTYTAQ